MVVFDYTILRPGSMSFDILGSSIESGRSMSGITGAIDYSAGGFWSVEYKNIYIETREQHVYWSYLRNNLSGGVVPINVPIDQHGSAPIPGDVPRVTSTFDDGVSFSDGASMTAGTITAFSSADFDAGASTIKIDVVEGGQIVGGETFSLSHYDKGWRAYSISEVDDIDGTVYTVGIRPPLRDSIYVGDVCEFIDPKCKMRLAPGSKIPMEAKPPWHNPSASISFLEYMGG